MPNIEHTLFLLEEDDPARPALEAMALGLAAPDFIALWRRTRAAAAIARADGDMPTLFRCVRGTKTLHRLADQRGIFLHRSLGL